MCTGEANYFRDYKRLEAFAKLATSYISELAQITLMYLERRSPRHKKFFQNTLRHLDRFNLAIRANNFNSSMAEQKKLLEASLFCSHVIRVEDQKEIPEPLFFDEDTPSFLAKETSVLRLWNRRPDRITFEGAQNLKEGFYYYLRPKWNTRIYDDGYRYRNRHEQFLPSDIPRWLHLFFQNIFIGERVQPKRFHDWILQFDDSERLLACQIFDMLTFYSEDDVRRMWLEIYQYKLPPEAKTKNVAFFGLGHGAKSGHRTCYSFQQAISTLSPHERSFSSDKAFQEISEFNKIRIERPSTVVFLDDFIGTGRQASRYITSYFKKYNWLTEVELYYCALVGFKDGIDDIKESLSEKISDVFVYKEWLRSWRRPPPSVSGRRKST